MTVKSNPLFYGLLVMYLFCYNSAWKSLLDSWNIYKLLKVFVCFLTTILSN